MNKINISTLMIAVVFGLVILAIVLAGFTIPIPGTNVVTDPREIFVTIGSALTGPIGAVIIGFFAGIAEPGGISAASLLAHIAGSLWMAFSYKNLVYKPFRMPERLLAWIFLIVIYYGLIISGFVMGLMVFYGGEEPMALFASLAKGAALELLITTIVTTLVLVALPSSRQNPLW